MKKTILVFVVVFTTIFGITSVTFADIAPDPATLAQRVWKEVNIPCVGQEVRCKLYHGRGCGLYRNNPFYYEWSTRGGATVGENIYCPNENLPPFYFVLFGSSALLLAAAIAVFKFWKKRRGVRIGRGA